MNKESIAKLSGIAVPKKLTKAQSDAESRLARIHEQINQHEQAAIDNSAIVELRKKAAHLLVDGKDTASIQAEISRLEGEKVAAEKMVVELKRMIPTAEEAVKEARSDIEAFIGPRLLSARQEMMNQFEAASTERSKTMMTRSDGRPVSSPPAKSSGSRVLVCEKCHEAIAIIADDIQQPIRAHHFLPLDERGIHPFLDCDFEFFKCKNCGGRPIWEGDKVLTNVGYRVVPEAEAEVVAENVN